MRIHTDDRVALYMTKKLCSFNCWCCCAEKNPVHNWSSWMHAPVTSSCGIPVMTCACLYLLLQGEPLRNRTPAPQQDDSLYHRAVRHGAYLQRTGSQARQAHHPQDGRGSYESPQGWVSSALKSAFSWHKIIFLFILCFPCVWLFWFIRNHKMQNCASVFALFMFDTGRSKYNSSTHFICGWSRVITSTAWPPTWASAGICRPIVQVVRYFWDKKYFEQKL